MNPLVSCKSFGSITTSSCVVRGFHVVGARGKYENDIVVKKGCSYL